MQERSFRLSSDLLNDATDTLAGPGLRRARAEVSRLNPSGRGFDNRAALVDEHSSLRRSGSR
ncbi:hypothetical protein [Actinomadura sp. NTSP31]|uniref:hypothetical protein n=1 Tax=Actinomadura sp. NTSP31 TaxID=1735447 RepID=UPI0035C11800